VEGVPIMKPPAGAGAGPRRLQLFSIPVVPPVPIDDLNNEVFYADSAQLDDHGIRFVHFGNATELPHGLKINELRGDLRKAPKLEIRPQVIGLNGSGNVSENEIAETLI
jgi:hypothetical protein